MGAGLDARQWFGLETTTSPDRWRLPVAQGLSTAGDFLFGGCALGAAVAALEERTDRPTIWATAQYLSYARPGTVLDLEIDVIAEGHHITQARVVGSVEGTPIVSVNAAMGSRPQDLGRTWMQAPAVPRPEACERREPRWNVPGAVMSRLDQRWALRAPELGHAAVWVRFVGQSIVPAPLLAVLGDFVPMGLAESIGGVNTSNSLDNTLRITDVVPTEWVLVDVRVEQVSRGIGHGHLYLWAEDGTLMGTASQSAIIRML